ncbi:MAG: hypothetical protein ACRCVN_02500 [Spirochaetia bacterium]
MDPNQYNFPALRVNQNLDDTDLFTVEIIDSLSGIVTDEYLYAKGELIQSTGYLYDKKSRIIQVVLCNQDNNILLSQNYIYNIDGNLWQIIEDQGMTLYTQKKTYTQRLPQFLTQDIYDGGLLANTKNFFLSELSEEKDYIYRDGYLLEKITKNYLQDTQHIATYDKNQRMIEQSYFLEGDFLETQNYQYNDQGLVTQKIIQSAEGNIHIEELIYDSQNQVLEKKVYAEGILSYVQTFTSLEDYIIDYYAIGGIRMREFYQKNQLIETKIIENRNKIIPQKNQGNNIEEGYEEF